MTDHPTKPRRWKRKLIVLGSILVVVLLLIAFFLPYLLKRYVETHSEEWIGRRVTIDRIVLNPFSFRYAITGMTCYEPQSDEVFVSWKDISVRADLWSGFQENDWRFSGLRITSPYCHIAQTGDRFNFSDLMELGGEEDTASDTSAPTRFRMEDIALTDGRVEYKSDVLPAPVGLQNLKATSTIISSENARMDFVLGFDLDLGGRMDGGFMVDTERSLYSINAQLRTFDLAQLTPYLKDFFDCKDFAGSMNVDLDLIDSYIDTTSLLVSAGLMLENVHLNDPNNENLISLAKGSARLDTLVAKDQRVEVGDVLLEGADLRFVMLADGSDNWTRLLKLDSTSVGADSVTTQLQASESNVFVLLAEYISYLGEQIVASDYTAKKLALTSSAVHFEDHTPAQPFRYTISAIDVTANRITSADEAGLVSASAVLQETGKLKASATFDPKNIRNVVVDMEVDDLALNHLDAYGRWYAAHPLEDGLLNYVTTTKIHDGLIDSQNTLRIDKLKVGKKVEEHDADIYVLPLRLAAGLLKDVKGVVELDVPVKGDLKDPEFKPWPIIWQVLKNLIVKAVTAPGRLLMRAFDSVDEEDLERVRFTYLQTAPDKPQAKTLKQLAVALKAKPEIQLDLLPTVDPVIEAQEVAIFHAKKGFLFSDKSAIDAADSTRINELSSRDSLFTRYVNERTPGMEGRSMHERCESLMGASAAKAVAAEIEAARKENVMQLILNEGLPAAQVRFREGTPEELAGQRGVPGYHFVYDSAE